MVSVKVGGANEQNAALDALSCGCANGQDAARCSLVEGVVVVVVDTVGASWSVECAGRCTVRDGYWYRWSRHRKKF